MIHIDNIHPLTSFKRNTAEFRDRLSKSGLPEVLTVDGRPALVVQDARAYQRLLDAIERIEAIEGIQDGLVSMSRREGVDAQAFFSGLRRDLRQKAKKRA